MYGFSLRHPRTTQERRYSCWMKYPEVEDTLFRAKRNYANLPNTYDDLWVSSSKCWKDRGRPKYRLNTKKRKKVERVINDWGQYRKLYDDLDCLGVWFEVNYPYVIYWASVPTNSPS